MENLHEGHRKRLRERYVNAGGKGFADHELLELLLTYAIPRRDVNALAHRLLRRFGSLAGVFGAPLAELASVEGLGESAAVFLSLGNELCSRLAVAPLKQNGAVVLSTTEDAARYALAGARGLVNERCAAILLDTKRRVVGETEIGTGTLVESGVYPRLAAEAALNAHAAFAVLCHNHPSGDPTPSDADRKATVAVQQALAAVGVTLLDHLVTGDGCVFSLAAGERIVL
ncbi:MAG: DNA repair protein RadC [Clostridia bacterium]|nr:DNA repair protein RadC [Clostridia bacterium]